MATALSNRPFIAIFSSATLAAVALTACGGDDEAAPAGPTAPVITAQPLDITLAEGTAGTLTVAATSDAGTIAYQWFNVSRGQQIAGANAPDFDFGPVSFASNGTQFNVGLTNTVGTTTSATRSLTVTERSWSAASDALSAGARQVATVVDSNGHTHLLAVLGNNLSASIEARIKLRSNDSTVANDFTVPGNAALQASAALSPVSTSIAAAANGAGNVLAVWHRNGIVGGALYTPGPNTITAGSWQLLPTRINSFSSNSVSDPAVTAVGDNSFEIVWRERIATSGVHDIMARSYTVDTNVLGAPVALEQLASETEAPRIVADAAGNVVAAWRQVGQGVWANRHASGAAWSTTLTQLDNSDMPLEVLRSNAAGKGVVVTSDRLGSGLASRLDLATPNLLVSGGGRAINAYGSSPDAFVDSAGRVHVVGVSVNTANGDSRLFRWWYDPQFSSWGGPEAVSDNVTSNFVVTSNGVYFPRLSGADSEGNFIVSWQERVSDGDTPLSHVKARRFHSVLDAWRPIVAVGDGNNLPTSVGIAAPGNATLVLGATSQQAVRAVSLR